MEGNHVFFPVHVPGTLAANVTVTFKAPTDLTLVKVSAVASNDSDATLKIGNSSDDDAYLVAATIGDSGTPVEKTRANFVGGEFPAIAAATVVVITLDYDGSAGTAAANVTLLLDFVE